MSGAEQPTTGGGDDGVVLSFATTNGFIVAAAMLLLILFIFSFILCLRAKRRWGGDPVAAAEDPFPQTSGLDAESMKALPWTMLRPDDFAGGADHCAVCLSEFSPGQRARVLPNCRHSFHVECIDGWLVAHTTCPLCRTQAAPNLLSCRLNRRRRTPPSRAHRREPVRALPSRHRRERRRR
ncbi:RING-H2 finger protein ATL74-like [Zingiber officinale]|uniref:RING-type domain-containing protein n=1 Tax=Zingiber officinale TaxID=94328 RepID=A0A8J5EZF7_ZINOF|nr:RING-H2 finger protein ATL74-like [Zingiber officinale]KAG6478038.1 hypothetical protein ZIOFF_061470 [Zingiber officinale]